MVLPINLLRAAQGQPLLVELKDGTTFNGILVNTDTYMNVNLKEVTCTSKEGDRFWKLPECYLRGITIKYFRLSEDLLDSIPDDDTAYTRGSSSGSRGRGQRGGNRPGSTSSRGGTATSTRGTASRGGATHSSSTRGGAEGSSRRGADGGSRGASRGRGGPPRTRGTGQ